MSKAKLPVVFKNGDFTVKNKEIELEVTGPAKELGKDLGVEVSAYLLETFDRVLENFFPKAVPKTIPKLASAVEELGNVVLAVEILNDIAFLVMDIVDAVRAANSTTFIFINAVPNSTLRVDTVNMHKGEWVGESEQVMKQDKAVNKAHSKKSSALVYHSEPFRSGGEQTGNLRIKVELPNHHTEYFDCYWDNPLGVDRKNRKANYHLNNDKKKYSHGAIAATLKSSHSDKVGKRRHDIVSVIVMPTAQYFRQSIPH